jgi:hypothetical protein
MAKINKNSLRLDADFTEDTVGFAIEAFLMLLSFPRLRFTIEPFSRSKEQWLGADANCTIPLNGYRRTGLAVHLCSCLNISRRHVKLGGVLD